MRDCQAAQAVELVRALRDQLHRMTTQLAWVEHQDVTGSTRRALRMEATELRRDIKEALDHIDQLQRRYLNDDRTAMTRISTQPSRIPAGSGRW
jgi:acyl-CoA reductase-like NAD-dependent aldehyde dehydrogenase